MSDDFFIGWRDEAPKSYTSKGRLFFAIVLLLMLTIGVVYVKSQRGFIQSEYEFGTLQEISGHLVKEPVWGLRVERDEGVQTIPLVGFGKMGPDWTLAKMIETNDLEEGTRVTFRGMIFHYQNKYWMELSEKEKSLVSVGESKSLARTIKVHGQQQLEGEIVDPKCFFGVMNPATKAVHRSCAIRCISGGIPPVLAIRENGEFVDYYFLEGEDDRRITQQLLRYIGVPVKLSGRVVTYDDWNSISIDPGRIQVAQEIHSELIGIDMAMCN